MTRTPAIQAKGLRKSFRSGKVIALDGLDFTVAPGELVAVTGASGSGKSTLLHALSGLLTLDAGHVDIFDRRPSRRSDWTRLRRSDIGMVFQQDWLLPDMTSRENVELAMIGTGRTSAERRRRANALLERVNAADFAHRTPAELSGGERQRVAVARGLANHPRILLADEPTGELDSLNSRKILELLFELRRSEGLTVVLVTHDEAVAGVCSRRVTMRDGTAFSDDRGVT